MKKTGGRRVNYMPSFRFSLRNGFKSFSAVQYGKMKLDSLERRKKSNSKRISKKKKKLDNFSSSGIS